MDLFAHTLNDILVDTFNIILKVQERHIRKVYRLNLSISEMHLIEVVSKDDNSPKTISDIAKALDITLSSVTVAINKLVIKNCVKKVRSVEDARVVYVQLTESGVEIATSHLKFHETMVADIAADMTEEEKEILVKGMLKLNTFFKMKYNSGE